MGKFFAKEDYFSRVLVLLEEMKNRIATEYVVLDTVPSDKDKPCGEFYKVLNLLGN